jgi:hypothetical protein
MSHYEERAFMNEEMARDVDDPLQDAAAEISALKEKLNEAEAIIGPLAQANIYDDQLHEVLISAETLRRARAFLENANG